tara:strand:+ start:611 stop:1114 length:504 start_codon:yes stop_codon:yes gene_type:complete
MVVWDFNEDKNYIKVNGYKVLNTATSEKASNLLKRIEKFIYILFKKLIKHEKITPEIHLLITTPFYLQEMQLEKDQGTIKFLGLNKPKIVTKTNKIKIGLDGNKRAKYRVIFLTLRDDNGKLKSLNSLKSLIIHELVHTALNHVTWKDDNHKKEFYEFENILKKYKN